MKRIFIVSFVLFQICLIEAATYYSISTDPYSLSSWDLNRTGNGGSPSNFTSGDVFVIQNGYTMTTSAAWSISGTGSKLWIENGGVLVATYTCTLATATTFQIDDGGTYKHSNTTGSGSTIFNGKESFASNSTVEILAWQTTGAMQGDISFGNLIWNITSGSGNPNLGGGLTTIQGNFEILSTGSSGSLVLTKSDAFSLTISGDLIISGGTLNLSNGTANTVINLSGNFEMTGGTITETSDGSGTIVFSSSVPQTITKSSGTISNTINFTINNSTGIILNNDLMIDGTAILTLTDGNITTGSNTLTLGTSASSLGTLTRTSGTIIGNFERWLATGTNSSFLFPVGTSSYYRPVTITTTGVTTGGKIKVSHNDGSDGTDLSTSIFDGTYEINRYSNMYWTLTGTTIAGGTFDLSLDANGQSGISDAAKLRIIHSSEGSTFDVQGSHSDGSGNVANRTGISIGTFDRFYIGSNSLDNPLPVELSSFTSVVNGNDVVLKWSTATEVNNYGFSVERASTPLGTSSIGMSSILSSGDEGWKEIGFVNGNGNSNCPKEYSFVDNTLTASGKYSYRLKQIDTDGKFEYSNEIEVDYVKANSFNLAQNFPNPFNPVTVINYQLPANSFVTLKVYDLLGKEVSTLVNGNMDAGNHNVNFNASSLSAGTYFYKLKAGDYTSVKKLMLVK